MSRSMQSLPEVHRALGVLAEHSRSIVATYDRVAIPFDARFTAGRDELSALTSKLESLASRRVLEAPTAAFAPPPSVKPAPRPDVSAAGFEIVRGHRIVLQFEAKRRLHARHCVVETPEVFIGNQRQRPVDSSRRRTDRSPRTRGSHVSVRCT